jgi:hypothetical protein
VNCYLSGPQTNQGKGSDTIPECPALLSGPDEEECTILGCRDLIIGRSSDTWTDYFSIEWKELTKEYEQGSSVAQRKDLCPHAQTSVSFLKKATFDVAVND